jgi:hypothetical protein
MMASEMPAAINPYSIAVATRRMDSQLPEVVALRNS